MIIASFMAMLCDDYWRRRRWFRRIVVTAIFVWTWLTGRDDYCRRFLAVWTWESLGRDELRAEEQGNKR